MAQVGTRQLGAGEIDLAQVLIAQVRAAQIGVRALAFRLDHAAVDDCGLVAGGERGVTGEQGQWQKQ
ncbi:hypothetical protein D3C77_746390 [compost metagenome]